MRRTLRTCLIGSALAALSSLAVFAPAQAQIATSELGEARAIAPGLKIEGALDPSAWTGTSADRATRLLEDVETNPKSPAVRDLLRRVVLAGLSPPEFANQADGEAFERARIRAAQSLARPGEYDRFSARNDTANDPRLRADAAIAESDLKTACEISDALTQDRGVSYWVRLRAACHEMRGETAAAELARDLLIERGDDPVLIIAEPANPFWARVESEDADALKPFISDLAISKMDLSQGIEFDLETAAADPSDVGTAQLYQLALAGDAKAAALFVTRGAKADQDPDWLLARLPAQLDPTQMAAVDLPLFARHASATRDVGLMQALYGATDSEADRDRLALASDALGVGFFGQPLGQSLEAGLDTAEGRADVLIALALGALMSEPVEDALDDMPKLGSEWIFIELAVERGARAEGAMRIATVLSDEPTIRDRYAAIRALRDLGLNDVAGQLAAEHFLQGL